MTALSTLADSPYNPISQNLSCMTRISKLPSYKSTKHGDFCNLLIGILKDANPSKVVVHCHKRILRENYHLEMWMIFLNLLLCLFGILSDQVGPTLPCAIKTTSTLHPITEYVHKYARSRHKVLNIMQFRSKFASSATLEVLNHRLMSYFQNLHLSKLACVAIFAEPGLVA